MTFDRSLSAVGKHTSIILIVPLDHVWKPSSSSMAGGNCYDFRQVSSLPSLIHLPNAYRVTEFD